MIILGIETSCDETALALIEAEGNSVGVLSDITHSQAALHAKYGGVFPNLAKREHSKNLIPLLKTALVESNLISNSSNCLISKQTEKGLAKMLNREPELLAEFLKFIPTIAPPSIDLIAVTEGPGLEPALWVGINFARALSTVWNIPVAPVNHMEGHIVSALLRRSDMNNEGGIKNSVKTDKQALSESSIIHNSEFILHSPSFPALALLISGGHTELVLIKKLGQYETIGETKDDAIGEAFDKVARILGLKYPGGPEISKLAGKARQEKQGSTLESEKRSDLVLPRPMLHSGDYNFSFSGLKTAVLYTVTELPKLTEKIKVALAREFEDAVTEVLTSKTTKAIKEFGVETLIIAGWVIANTHIRASFEELRATAFPSLEFLIPEIPHSTDNALMIAVAGFLRLSRKGDSTKASAEPLLAKGDLRLDEK